MIASFVHEALFYRDSDDYLAGTVPFVEAALAGGEPVLVAVPGPRIDALGGALGARAVDVRFLDMTLAGRNPGTIIPWVLHSFLLQHAGQPVRMIGEPIWAGRSADEYPACVQHEALINVAFAGQVARILCPYDTGALGRDVLDDAARTHPVLVDVDARTDSAAYTDPDAMVAAFNQPFAEPVPGAAALDFDAPSLPSVRRFVALHAGRAGLSRGRVADLQLAANELAANAIVHGGGGGRLRMWRAARQVVCEVRDRGRAVARLAGRVPPGPDSLGGRGLVLVNFVSDLVRIHTGPAGTAVRCYLDI
ncbi:MAG: anti-sigma regulatory factor [Actinobacteria bacterium 13_2_20CM_2_71_6]|nr:MAG: anti-sigma regulatory factor [Actinobacteria bacterium 13_2_20CM_2_71_6]